MDFLPEILMKMPNETWCRGINHERNLEDILDIILYVYDDFSSWQSALRSPYEFVVSSFCYDSWITCD